MINVAHYHCLSVNGRAGLYGKYAASAAIIALSSYAIVWSIAGIIKIFKGKKESKYENNFYFDDRVAADKAEEVVNALTTKPVEVEARQ